MSAIPELSHHIHVLLELDGLERVLDNVPNHLFFDPVRGKLLDIKKQCELTADDLPNVAGEKFVEIAKNQIKSLQSGNSTGMMANSIEIKPGGKRGVLITETAESPEGFPYPLAFEKGRREVVPVEAKALRWWEGGGVGGTPIFAKKSRATSPRPFWANTEAAIYILAHSLASEELAKKGV